MGYRNRLRLKIALFAMLCCLPLAAAFAQPYVPHVLRAGVDDWEPYEFPVDRSEAAGIGSMPRMTGFSVEVMLAVFGKMNKAWEGLLLLPWSRAERLLADGDIDVLFSASPSDKRREFAWFPDEPLVDSSWVLFVERSKLGQNRFRSLPDLAGKSVGVVRDYAYTPEFWAYIRTNATVEEVATDETNFRKLAVGRLQYVTSEYLVGQSIIKRLGLRDRVVALTDNPIKIAGLYPMFSKKTISEDFVRSFSDTLREFRNTAAYQAIRKKYL